jgi:hypothetical protein
VRLLPRGKAALYLIRVVVIFGLPLALSDLVLMIKGIKMAGLLFSDSNLSALRAWIPLLGGPTRNDSVMIVLATLPYAMACWDLERKRNQVFLLIGLGTAAALVAVMILSFSRGIYLALAVFFAGCFAFTVRNTHLPSKAIGTFCLIVCGTAGASVAYLHNQRTVVDTISVNRTASQQRSALGRVTIWSDTVRQIGRHPFLGNGGHTDGFDGLARLKSSSTPFTARAYNASLEVALSSGVLGLLAYGTFLLFPLSRAVRSFWLSHRGSGHSPTSAIFASGIMALIIRDMTYSSLVLHGATILIAWITVGLLQNSLTEGKHEVTVNQ